MKKITKKIAAKVLEVVDCGLSHGVGIPEPGKMCVEAAVCYALGLPHGDDPQCVSPALRQLKISLNDKCWSSPMARAKGLRRLALAQLGSKGVLDDSEFAKRVAELAIRSSVPVALRAAASIHKNAEHRQKMLDAAARCEKKGTKAAANAAYAAYAAAYAAATAAAANAAYAAYAAAYAAANAAYAAYAAYAAATAADNAAYAAAAATAAAYAAAAAAAANAATRDRSLAEFAEGVVQILIAMGAPGCQWLYLTEGEWK
ncbi:MAG: hypothetical protein AB7F22_07695 [Reyranella sp.]|uniref:hypothetical protein n=1 Tax=Reyranella sp. TaxID=1929291 RepID=UPI003D0EB03A